MRLRPHCLTGLAVAMFIAAPVLRAEQAKPTPPNVPKQQQMLTAANDVKVTVKYTGKGMVDATHRVFVWLFTTPDIGPGSIPIDEQSLEKNGTAVTFKNVSANPVYIAIAYDEKGGFSGGGPPPVGSPVTFYGAKGPQDKPAPVVPGPKAVVVVTLTDVQRMQ